jgi:hypothetical protein
MVRMSGLQSFCRLMTRLEGNARAGRQARDYSDSRAWGKQVGTEQVGTEQVPFYAISKIASTSTAAPVGRAAKPSALRAW